MIKMRKVWWISHHALPHYLSMIPCFCQAAGGIRYTRPLRPGPPKPGITERSQMDCVDRNDLHVRYSNINQL